MSFRIKHNWCSQAFVIVKAIYNTKDVNFKKMKEIDQKIFIEFLKEKCPTEYDFAMNNSKQKN